MIYLYILACVALGALHVFLVRKTQEDFNDRFNPFNLKPYGKCPVQIEGKTIDGLFFYFRARGQYITFCVSETKELAYGMPVPNGFIGTLWRKSVEYGVKLEAGYISNDDAIRLCTFWLKEFEDAQYQHKIDEQESQLNSFETLSNE